MNTNTKLEELRNRLLEFRDDLAKTGAENNPNFIVKYQGKGLLDQIDQFLALLPSCPLTG